MSDQCMQYFIAGMVSKKGGWISDIDKLYWVTPVWMNISSESEGRAWYHQNMMNQIHLVNIRYESCHLKNLSSTQNTCNNWLNKQIIYFSYNVLISLLTDTTIHIRPLYRVSRPCIRLLVVNKCLYLSWHSSHISLHWWQWCTCMMKTCCV